MQKVANRLIHKMVAAHLTGKEIDFLIYISRFQDGKGRVSGVHYKAVCGAMHMSYQEFYNVMRSLELMKFIEYEKTNSMDYDITILENIYAGREKEYESEGYVNTNHNIFYCEDFLEMKAGAKLLSMLFMQMGLAGASGRYEIGVGKFYDKYTKLLGVTKRVIRSYVHELKQFFNFEIKDRKYIITAKRVVKKKKYAKSEIDNYREHNVETICRRNRIKDAGKKAKSELQDLLCQYRNVAAAIQLTQGGLTDALASAVRKSLEFINEGVRGTWKRRIDIKLIHKLLRQELRIA